MALRLNDYVIRGELINLKKNSTHGWLELAGLDSPLVFELTGDPGDDLRGKHIRFAPAPNPWAEPGPDPRSLHLAPRQIGPTGTISAARWVKTFDCSIADFLRRSKLGEPPPTTWKRLLCLEWFSQNGRVVIELPGAAIEYALDPAGEQWAPLPAPHPSPDEIESAQAAADLPPQTGLDITIINSEGKTRRFQLSDDAATNDTPGRADPAEALQRQLDAQAAAVDRAIQGAPADGDADDLDQLMNDLMEDFTLSEVEEDPLEVDLFAEPQKLPDPDALSDEDAETVFKILLGQLAMLGIALHVCEHFTPLQAYRLLVERIFPETRVLDRVQGSGGMQCFMTSEYCAACAAEFESR